MVATGAQQRATPPDTAFGGERVRRFWSSQNRCGMDNPSVASNFDGAADGTERAMSTVRHETVT